MSPKEYKPNYRVVYRTHYPLYHEPNPDKEKRAIAKKSITEKYENFGIFLNLDEVTFIR